MAAHAAALSEGVTPLPTGGSTASGEPHDSEGAEAKAAPSADTRPEDTPGATAAAPGSTVSATAPAAVPADPMAALKDLAATVRRTADAHTATLLDAPPEYARLLASVAAAGAAHAFLLTEGGRA